MSTKYGNTYSSPKNIDLREGILRFDVSKTSNPLANDSTGWGLYINSSNQLVYWNKTSATVVSGTGTAGSLDAGYDLGQTITVDNGAIVFNDASTGSANVLEFNKTGTGSGNILDFDFTAAFTGNAINLDMGSAVAAVGIVIDSETGARTGSDIVFTDDSTGASHTNIEINKSGSGASGIAFKYVGSYTGSPAGQVFNIDLNADDNLDTEVMQLTTGSGDRAIMFDFNFAHTDAGTTSHVWDIDMSGVFDSNVFDFATSAACTGNVFFLNMDNGVAMTALHIEGSGVRTQPLIELTSDCTGSAQYIDLDIAGAGSGNFIDILVGAATYTGNVLDIDLGATATGSQAIVLTSGVMTRTTALVEITDSGTPSGVTILATISGAATGAFLDVDVSGIMTAHILDLTYSAAATGNAINVVMADNVAGAALNITAAGARTDSLIEVVSSETGSIDGMVLLRTTGVFTGSMLTAEVAGAATTGSVAHINLDAGVAYKAITIDHAGAREVETVLVTFDGTFASGAGGTFLNADISMTGAAASPFIDIDVSGVYTGNIFDVALGAASTGDVISIDMNAGVAASAIVIDAGNAVRTDDLIKITDDGSGNVDAFAIVAANTGSGSIFDINVTGVRTGNIIDIAVSGAATSNILFIDMDAAVAATALRIDAGAALRTQPLIEIVFDGTGDTIGGTLFDIDVTNTGATASPLFDIDVTAVYTGNIIDIVFGNASASTGDALHVDMGTNLAGNAIQIDAAGARSAPLIYIANTGSDAGTDDHVLFINQTGLLNSNLIQLTFGTAASDGEAIAISMGTNLAGSALTVNGTGARTDDLIKIDDDSSGSGHIFDINLSGIYTGNVLDIDFSTAAATGEAVMIAMGTNVAGRAIAVTSAGTGVSGEGNVLDITHTGILVAGADIVNITSSGAISSTSNALAIEPAAGDAGSYALYINAGGSCEGIKVDAGTVTFDETLTVTGACTFSSTITYRHLTEVVTEANTILAAESGTVYFLNSATEFDNVLPAPAAGLTFTFIVDAAPVGANYTISTNASANVIYGTAHSSTGGDASNGAGVDTINFVASSAIKGDKVVVECDGTSWYATGFSNADAAITFTTAS